jgi:hypothetical protein
MILRLIENSTSTKSFPFVLFFLDLPESTDSEYGGSLVQTANQDNFSPIKMRSKRSEAHDWARLGQCLRATITEHGLKKPLPKYSFERVSDFCPGTKRALKRNKRREI